MTIVLLKNRSDDSDYKRPDPYEQECSECVFVPIMTYKNINLVESTQDLSDIVNYDGIIVTSQRAVDAIKLVLYGLPETVYEKPVYTVGPTTAHRLEVLGFSNVIGADTGNGVALAQLMLSTLKKPSTFLFLAGEIHRRNLPDKLMDAGHSVHTRIVYYTEPDCEVGSRLKHVVNPGDWIVFFSPSHTDRVLEFIRETDIKFKLAAIGPTTEEFLREHNFTVDATAKDPSAAGLIKAINEANRSS